MYFFKDKIGFVKSVGAAVAASLLLTATASAAPAKRFVLAAFQDAPGGEAIVAGDYQGGLAAIAARGSERRKAATAINLCVAHAALGHRAEARAACDEAVHAAKLERRFSTELSTRSSASRTLAMAYSNRAVMHFLSQNALGATEDFARAAALAPREDFVAQNLEKLRSMQMTPVQVAKSPDS